MAKTVIKKIKIIKKNNSKKQTLNEISDLMETCMISETESQKYKDLEMKITDLESQLMIKREQLKCCFISEWRKLYLHNKNQKLVK